MQIWFKRWLAYFHIRTMVVPSNLQLHLLKPEGGRALAFGKDENG